MPTPVNHDARGIAMQARILAYIEKHHAPTVVEMVDALKTSPSNLHHHLRMMAAEGLAHSKQMGRNKKGTWHLGEDPAPGAEETNRPTPKTWKPHHVRDELVAFLFGPAQQGACA